MVTSSIINTTYILKFFERGGHVDVFITDIRKVFNRVDLGLLLGNLESLIGIGNPLVS